MTPETTPHSVARGNLSCLLLNVHDLSDITHKNDVGNIGRYCDHRLLTAVIAVNGRNERGVSGRVQREPDRHGDRDLSV